DDQPTFVIDDRWLRGFDLYCFGRAQAVVAHDEANSKGHGGFDFSGHRVVAVSDPFPKIIEAQVRIRQDGDGYRIQRDIITNAVQNVMNTATDEVLSPARGRGVGGGNEDRK